MENCIVPKTFGQGASLLIQPETYRSMRSVSLICNISSPRKGKEASSAQAGENGKALLSLLKTIPVSEAIESSASSPTINKEFSFCQYTNHFR
jgi:hypothetical protein